ncbi:hypothetical protein AKJ09_07765 [Labilithrix luteola]|uniref:Uncharacterized protein n=1 Tax=Labilithrix luteola TaxID=1391654 RepID=A0A0K1Q610_9BACT|nr:hypothetical protein AKJ09_07765 [Labilithrix luteola]
MRHGTLRSRRRTALAAVASPLVSDAQVRLTEIDEDANFVPGPPIIVRPCA